MPLRAWDPLGDLLKLQERLNRLIQASLAPGGPSAASLDGTWSPPADAYETAEAFFVQLDLPGVDEQDLVVEVDGEKLVVRGQRRCEGPLRAESFHRMERTSGAFSRSFVLPERVDTEHVKAQLKDGMLRLELPKLRPRRARGERGT